MAQSPDNGGGDKPDRGPFLRALGIVLGAVVMYVFVFLSLGNLMLEMRLYEVVSGDQKAFLVLRCVLAAVPLGMAGIFLSAFRRT